MASKHQKLYTQTNEAGSSTEDQGGSLGNPCVPLAVTNWHPLLDTDIQKHATTAVEQGKLLLFPDLSFTLTRTEEVFLRNLYSSADVQSLVFIHEKQKLSGLPARTKDIITPAALLKRYAESAHDLMARLFPGYVPSLSIGNTIFRYVNIKQHKELLQIDTCALQPSKGQRILRVLTNINPQGKSFAMRVGEPFESLATRFMPRLKAPLPGMAHLLRILGTTRSVRTAYDHYMLKLCDTMMQDNRYQAEGPQISTDFAPGTSVILFTDQIPHVIAGGQYILEQIFTLPDSSQNNPSTSPLRILEKLMNKKLA